MRCVRVVVHRQDGFNVAGRVVVSDWRIVAIDRQISGGDGREKYCR